MVAGVIRDQQGRILLSQRPPGKHLAGTWEFPGGKLEPAEAAADGLIRELDEELGIQVQASSPLLSLTHHYPEKTVRLLLREVEQWDGQAHGREDQPIGWFKLSDMHDLPMPAADRPMLKALGLDARLAISPHPDRFSSVPGFLADWEARLSAGYRWLVLSISELSPSAQSELARACGALARQYRARWLIHADAETARRTGADGLYLSAIDLRLCRARPLPESALVCAECRDVADLALAGRIGLDFVVVASALEVDSASMNWPEVSRLCAQSPLPVLVAGSAGLKDLSVAREHGAFGVAGVWELAGASI